MKGAFMGGTMCDLAKLRRQATELAYRGKHKQAATLYTQLLAEEPDAQTAVRLADLRRKLGDTAGARQSYEQAAGLFQAVGLEGKAQAVRLVAASLERMEAIEAVHLPWWRKLLGT
jgi:hypothetical protein